MAGVSESASRHHDRHLDANLPATILERCLKAESNSVHHEQAGEEEALGWGVVHSEANAGNQKPGSPALCFPGSLLCRPACRVRP